MKRYLFENLDRAGLCGVDAEVQYLAEHGVAVHTAAIISRMREDLHAIEIVAYDDDDPLVHELVARAGGREVRQ